MALADEQLDELTRTWQSPPGVLGWFQVVNQTNIGLRYIVSAMIFFLAAGVLGVLIRMQLAVPENDMIGPEWYNQIFSVHGITMMFLFAIPIVEGFGVYLVPLMLGTRDLSFPRLSAFSYFVFLIGGVLLWLSLLIKAAPDAGWFDYVPLALKEYSPSYGVDVYATVITFIEVAALAAAVELVVTILKQRAPGMTLSRMPVFVWSMLVTALMIIFAMPGVIVASVMLALDRIVSTKFFYADAGGDSLLWQHLFWWFGHPEVYIAFLPAAGIVSTIVPVFCRRPLFGYTAVVCAIVATGVISFGLWVHHMFTTGLPVHASSFFSAASFAVAIPSGIQVIAWIATIWWGKPIFKTAFLYCLGFITLFVLGGLTGVMVASIPFDKQVHDSFFVVAHFHYVLIGGVVFPIFGGLYYWWPKFTGRLMSERLGKINFWLTFIGFNITFFPMHLLGFQGMPRRIYTYLPGLNWEGSNMVATIGAYILTLGVFVFVVNAVWSLKWGELAGDNPWGANTLEWLTSSPPAPYNFAELPCVESLDPLWDRSPDRPLAVVYGLRTDRREVLVTTVERSEPQSVIVLPGPTLWPLTLALACAVGFAGSIFHPIWFVIGFIAAIFAGIGWFWPSRPWGSGRDH
jgi:cytochrome c oxidase subunit I+III